ncbi:MAG: AraC family transcriptional regulator [Lachnospiraceae bacterium]|nr:AraC family transcriptional regulator [Lachnospiraceae bacterium]
MRDEIISALSVITEEERAILEGTGGIDKSRYAAAGDMVVDAKRLLERGRLIQIRPHTRFAYFPKHRHNYIEMIYMCKGETTHVIDGNRIELKEGEILILNRNAVQEIEPAGKDDIAVNFIILPQFFDKVFDILGEENSQFRSFLIECLLSGKAGRESYLYYKVTGVAPVQNLIENMLLSMIGEDHISRYMIQVTMGLLFLNLMNYTDRLFVGGNDPDKELAISILKYIDEHYKDGSLAGLASELSYDLAFLSKRIKALCGENFRDLVKNKRLSRAEFLLRTTDMPVADIAETVGYENKSFFYRAFKEEYGKSPAEYRKKEKK